MPLFFLFPLGPWFSRDPFVLSLSLPPPVPPYPSSVRIFEGVKDKSPDDITYNYVVEQLKPVIDELQLSLPEELGLQ